jgi:uncharacterized protein
VALDWKNRQILLGECKWGADSVSRDLVRELIEQKTPRVLVDLPGGPEAWHVTYALFSRVSFTEAAAQELATHQGFAVDAAQLMADLIAALHSGGR